MHPSTHASCILKKPKILSIQKVIIALVLIVFKNKFIIYLTAMSPVLPFDKPKLALIASVTRCNSEVLTVSIV